MSPNLFMPTVSAAVLATTASQAVALAGQGDVVRVASSEDVMVSFGASSGVTVSLADGMLVVGGAPEMFRLKGNVSHVAVIKEDGSARVSFTRGQGDV